jgi:hypothetical protein
MMDWDDIEAVCARIIDRRNREVPATPDSLQLHSDEINLVMREIAKGLMEGKRLPPASSHPALSEMYAEFDHFIRQDLERRGVPPEAHDRLIRKIMGKARKQRVTDTIVSLLKVLDRDHAPRKVITAIAEAEKIVITSADSFLIDLMPHVGITDYNDVTFANIADIALNRFRERGAVPMPFPRIVISLRLEAEPGDEDPPLTMVMLVTTAPVGTVLEFQGYVLAEDSDPRWIGPYEFKLRLESPSMVMRDTDRHRATGAKIMFDACVTVLLAASLPHTRGAAPGERPFMTPKIAGRPVLPSRFRTLELLPPVGRESVPRGPVGERHPPAYHSVKSHDRHLKSGKVIRVKEHHRGDAKGLIEKVYIH